MSARTKAAELAASLAAMANAGMVGKGYGYTVTAADLVPVASAMVSLDRQSRRNAKLLRRNAALIESMTGPAATGVPAAEAERRYADGLLRRFEPLMVSNGHDKHLPTTNGIADVTDFPGHPG